MSNFILNQYFIVLLITGVINFSLCIFVISRGFNRRINQVFALYSLSLALWSTFEALAITQEDAATALLFWRINHIGVIFIPVFLIHFIYLFLNLRGKRTVLIPIAYSIAWCFLVLNLTSLFIFNVVPKFSFRYFINPGYLYPWFLVFWFALAIHGNIELLKEFFSSKGHRREQIKLFIWALLLSYIGGVPNFLPTFNIEIPWIMPYGTYAISFYAIVAAYSIIRYRLIDIKLVITRLGIFVFVYTLVLGIPFGIGLKHLGIGAWLIPCLLMAALATIGPFVYLYLQRKAEQQMLAEQHQYQATLRQASLGMGRIKNLKRLLNLIVHILTRTVRMEHSSIYLLHKDSGQYTLKAFKGNPVDPKESSVFTNKSLFIQYLQQVRDPILYEEIKEKAADYQDKNLKEVAEAMAQLKAELVIPCFIEDQMLAFVVLGKRLKDKMYTHDDLVVFSILANQSALAIENAQFYEDMKKTHEQLFKAEKMATLGTMADGLSHQINNRLHAMGFIAGDALDTIHIRGKDPSKIDEQKFTEEMKHALERIQDNVKRGGEIVEGLLKYTRKGEEGFTAVDLNQLLDASLEMAQFKVKLSEMSVIRDFGESTPKIFGNFTQLQEVFFNLIDNSYDSIIQRKQEMKEEGYKGRLRIAVEKKGKNLIIDLKDNGMGVKEEDLHKIFTPFFTTKLSSKKGTGLGMYVIRQIIEENHSGKVEFSSTYKEGARTKIMLPVEPEKGEEGA